MKKTEWKEKKKNTLASSPSVKRVKQVQRNWGHIQFLAYVQYSMPIEMHKHLKSFSGEQWHWGWTIQMLHL